MVESKWWSKLLVIGGGLALVLLLLGPMLYKLELAGLMPAFGALLVALALAVIVLLGSFAGAFVAVKHGLARDRNLVVIALILSLVPIVIMVPTFIKGRSVPAIHDITTDTANPPTFERVVGLRVNAPNGLDYGSEQVPAAALAQLQMKAYPDLHSLNTALPLDAAVSRAAEVLESLGLEVVNKDPDRGIVEAVATTFWFGFKDDLVVRVKPTAGGSILDVRSVSRVGQSDLGANAARIRAFLAAFQGSSD